MTIETLTENCLTCFETVEQYFPGLSRQAAFDLLIGSTAYPMAGCEHVAKQVKDMHDLGITTVGGCCAYADTQMEKEMAAHHAKKKQTKSLEKAKP